MIGDELFLIVINLGSRGKQSEATTWRKIEAYLIGYVMTE